jgi:hypothetical protein
MMVEGNKIMPSLCRINGWTFYAWAVVLLLLLFLTGCAASLPQPASLDYRSRTETQVDGRVRVSAVVLSPQETESVFSIALEKKGVQPVWLEIENQEDNTFYMMLLSLDPDYFSPSEVAWLFRMQDDSSLDDRIDMFLDHHIPVVVPPHSTVSGYVYTNLDPGAKAFAVELFGK